MDAPNKEYALAGAACSREHRKARSHQHQRPGRGRCFPVEAMLDHFSPIACRSEDKAIV
jgi:hypothetical protein